MPKFHELTVSSIEREIDGAVTIEFHCPDELRDEFAYASGQHLGLRRSFAGRDQRRTYSICSSVSDSRLRIGVRLVEEGLFSTYLNEELKVGDKLDVMTPTGHFGKTASVQDGQHYVAFASGSGITPILSILKTRLETEPASTVTLFFGNRTRRSVMLLEDVEALKNAHPTRVAIHHVLSREKHDIAINEGRIDAAKCADLWDAFLAADPGDDYFVCGPATMIEDVKATLLSKGVDAARIHFERFGLRKGQMTGKAAAAPTDEGNIKVAVVVDGVRNEFTMSDDGETLLDAANERGIDLPYSCTAGVCSTCRAKLVEGEVEMRVNYALEPWETEAGFILTCQAVPKSDVLTLTYDDQ